jgi:hypothetical protein
MTSGAGFAIVVREGEADVVVLILDTEREANDIAVELGRAGRPVAVQPYLAARSTAGS